VRLLSVLPADLPSTIQRLQADARDQRRALGTLQEELAKLRAQDLAASADPIPVGRLVVRALDADANGLKSLAAAVTAKPGHVVVLVSTSRPALVVVARSNDVANVSSQQVVAALTAQFGGRGGGKPELAQAGALDAAPETILDAARAAITRS
jgi:alanyl-tRNA synthetase